MRELVGCDSFPAATFVLLADGSRRAISEIEVDDLVVSYDEDARVWNTNRVTGVWSADHRDPLVTVAVAGGGFTSTADHLVWEDSGSRWVAADELAPGDALLTPTGPEVVLSTTGGVLGDGIVWDITVANDHNFLVSNPATGPPVLVHNCDLEYITDADGNPIGIRRTTESGDVIEAYPDRKIVTGADGSSTRYNLDGNTDYIDPYGNVYEHVRVDADGNVQFAHGDIRNPMYDRSGGAERSSALTERVDGDGFDSDGGLHYQSFDPNYTDRVDHILQHEHGYDKPLRSSHSTFPEGVDPIEVIDEAWTSPDRLVERQGTRWYVLSPAKDGTLVNIIVESNPDGSMGNKIVTAWPG